jgi:hypothetical protein
VLQSQATFGQRSSRTVRIQAFISRVEFAVNTQPDGRHELLSVDQRFDRREFTIAVERSRDGDAGGGFFVTSIGPIRSDAAGGSVAAT